MYLYKHKCIYRYIYIDIDIYIHLHIHTYTVYIHISYPHISVCVYVSFALLQTMGRKRYLSVHIVTSQNHTVSCHVISIINYLSQLCCSLAVLLKLTKAQGSAI